MIISTRQLPLILACCLAASSLAPPFADSEEPAAAQARADDFRVRKLLADLGNDDYAIRESATDGLIEIGPPASPALEEASKDPDREIRYRVQRILGLIRHSDLERRLVAFARGKEDSDDPLPAWNRYLAVHGDTPSSRAMFVDMQRGDPDLMRSLESDPQTAAELLEQRMAEYQQAQQAGSGQLSLGQLAAALFVASEEDVALPNHTVSAIFGHCYQATLRDAISSPHWGAIPRKMLGSIIRRSEDLAAYQAMNIAYQYQLPEGIVPAMKILERPNPLPHMSQYALMTVARLGDASHLPAIERLMDNSAVVTQLQENETVYTVQLRDAALAAAVLLTKQDLRTYFDVPAKQQISEPQMIFFNARTIGFASDERRAEVFAKWAKFKAAEQGKSATERG